ncbi:hypothetical protein A2716_02570 [candidate division WWE3 bacterium RIFCSPHIGHO2_01_FULL_40_23]|uniref:Uncharacterized protein n=1 Tax=candidate division WWE3 bacterium RIFCSPLOWO2_01_FULL_41_18 TaxID=1802625 RepID=A0A1F4VFG9_UNCKA|nr:MAG: hypothetical protein A2716_02570 [candidate division WWE3 bacterium RIFCSPHIGHO2_01_FULL_40_23]OGC55869.1 MAG: hypothetical protein A3A78_02420 [candidate division WWE3 bacterium RIFCSPLOWO2_01_FULL_41_18]
MKPAQEFNKEKRNGFALVPVLVVILILITLVAGGYFLFPAVKDKLPSLKKLKSLKTTGGEITLEEKSATERVRGNAEEDFPFGEIKDDFIVNGPLEQKGGVFVAELANNVKAYLVIPPGYAAGGEVYRMTPYFSMPTSERAPALPTDFGYGVDFESETAHFEGIDPVYLVFDLDQGKTVKEIIEDDKLNFFCMPLSPYFNPAGCAFIKRIPLSEHTNRKYAVVSPVRSVEFNDLMFMNTTIPIGYDGLLVSQVTTQATYIPIKLTKDVLTDVVRANRQNYSIPRIEAVTHAVSNDIFFNEPVSYGHIQKAFQVEEDLYDSFKAAATLKNFEAYLNKAKDNAGGLMGENEAKDVALSVSSLTQDIEEMKTDVDEDLKEKFEKAGTSSHSRGYESLTAVFQIRRMEEEGYKDATKIRKEMVKNIRDDINQFISDDYDPEMNDYMMLLAWVYGSPELFSSVKLENLNKDTSSLFTERIAYAESNPKYEPDYTPLGPNPSEADKKALKALTDRATFPLRFKCTANIWQIEAAIEVAGRIGRWDLVQELMELGAQVLIDDVRYKEQSKSTVANEMAEAQILGADDNNCLNQLYMQKLLLSTNIYECEVLMKKNLRTFAWNYLKCDEVMERGSTAITIPEGCGLKPEEKPPLKCENKK